MSLQEKETLEQVGACWEGLEDSRSDKAVQHDFHKLPMTGLCWVLWCGQGRVDRAAFDNLLAHTRKAATDWFGEEEGGWLWSRFTVHHTPKHGSWLNQAEIEIGLFSRQCLGKRRIASLEELTQQAEA